MNSYWPLAVLIPLTLLVLVLARPLRSAISAWASQYTDTPDESRLAAAEALKAELDNEARQGAMAEEILELKKPSKHICRIQTDGSPHKHNCSACNQVQK